MKKDCSPAAYPVGYWITPEGCGQVVDYTARTITVRIYGKHYTWERDQCEPLTDKGYERPMGGFDD